VLFIVDYFVNHYRLGFVRGDDGYIVGLNCLQEKFEDTKGKEVIRNWQSKTDK